MAEDEDLALQQAISQSLEEEEERRQDAEALEEARRISLEDWSQPAPLAPAAPSGSGVQLKQRTVPSDLLDSFAPAQWLSDASLCHGFAQLASSASLAQLGGGRGPSLGEERRDEQPGKVLLLDPATAFWLAFEDNRTDLEEARSSLRLSEREVLLCPVTDSQDRCKADSGTHWSLLVCWRPASGREWRCAFYDSLCLRSSPVASEFGSHITQAATIASQLLGRSVQVQAGCCAQQTNSFDCGVYVLLFSRLIVGAVLKECHSSRCMDMGPWLWEPRLQTVTPEEVEEHRQTIWKELQGSAKSAD